MAVHFLPLGFMAALFRLSLMTMAAIASRLIENEPLTKYRVVAILLGILGIVLMAQPDFIFSMSDADTGEDVNMAENFTNTTLKTWNSSTPCNDSEMKRDQNHLSPMSLFHTENLSENVKFSIGVTLTVFCAFLGLLQGILMKRKGIKDYCVWKLSFWVGAVAVLWTSSFSLAFEDFVFIQTFEDLSLVGIYAIVASVHSFTFFLALKKTSYLIVAIIMATQIIFNLIAQHAVLKSTFEKKNPVFEITGAALVLIAAVLPPASEIEREKWNNAWSRICTESFVLTTCKTTKTVDGDCSISAISYISYTEEVTTITTSNCNRGVTRSSTRT